MVENAFDQVFREIGSMGLDKIDIGFNCIMGLSDGGIGRYEEAVSVYDKATQVEPENAMLLNKKGEVLIELEMYEKAVTAFDKALEINP